MASSNNWRVLNLANMNPQIKDMEYAVRGPLVIRAGEIEKELDNGVKKTFTRIIKANIGDSHAMGQMPITFIRQVLALVTYPPLLEDPKFPADAKERARGILKNCGGGSIGSYTDSAGLEIVRRHVAQYIENRDEIASNWENIIISGGAIDAAKNILKLMICNNDGTKVGVMVPIPQCPLYSATIVGLNMQQIGYYLNESRGWTLEVSELQRAISEARTICNPKAIVIINPGNPTGQVLTRQNIEAVIKFAHKERLFLLADEVYQDNVYDQNSKFIAFKKVLTEMGEPYSSMELASFMSCSKGYMGECGLRGGYVEIINMCPKVKTMYLKAISAMLCPTVHGQATVDAVFNPPKKGEPSYEQFMKEKNGILDSLKIKAQMVTDAFNSLEGFKCNTVQGALYAFPSISLPEGAIEAARRDNKAPDVFYAFQLLENTGICIVPGSGFGQQEGTYHFRTTILPPPDELKIMLEKFADFHRDFISRYTKGGPESAITDHVLTIDNMNPNIIAMEYAVRGPLVTRAIAIQKQLDEGMTLKPFRQVIRANIGDCHAMGQTPITFIRQLLTLVTYPTLLNDTTFPDDVKSRARDILKSCRGGSIGSYTDAPGIELIRRHVAHFIEKRDMVPCNWENIVLSAGASDAIKNILKLLNCEVDGKKPGVMVSVPQYPLYSATIVEFNMVLIGYYLDEGNGWGLNMAELQRAVDEAKKFCFPRALVVINPGNPTGQVLTRKNIESVIKFAHKERLFLLSDEVYQDNIYDENSAFFSFKKVLTEMGDPYKNMELASFMSCSKGYLGECGLRGGYVEVINMDPEVKAMYMKALSAALCPCVHGQATVDALANPPQKGEPSYEQYITEKKAVLESFKMRAKMVVEAFQSFEGYSCNPIQGALYAFPQITLPPKAIEAALEANQEPDAFYAARLLESTGICIVPGSGFGQQPGTYHFRTTILPQPDKLKEMLKLFGQFHQEFLRVFL